MALLQTSLGAFQVLPQRSLVWRQQPSTTRRREEIVPPPAVEVHTDGVLDEAILDGEVSVSLIDNEEGATLIGPTSASCAGGVAEFPGLSIDRVGIYRLAAECDEDTLVYPEPEPNGLGMTGALFGFGYVDPSHEDVTQIGGWGLSGIESIGGDPLALINSGSTASLVSQSSFSPTEPGAVEGAVAWWHRFDTVPTSLQYICALGDPSNSGGAGRAFVVAWRPNPGMFVVLHGGTEVADAPASLDSDNHVYGVSWDASGIVLHVDGVAVLNAAMPSLPGAAYKIALNTYHPNALVGGFQRWFGAGVWGEAKGAAWHLEQARRCGVAP